MRAINPPCDDPSTVYLTCINSIADEGLRNRLSELTSDIEIYANHYRQKGLEKQLYILQPNHSLDDQVILGTVTKKELKNVYSSHMVGKRKPARAVYDALLSKAPNGRCPFCGLGHASTLDHFLPKTKYPQLSVVPLNLVPSCKDCNTGKSSAVASRAEEQCLHPYFDREQFIHDQWLFAEIIDSVPQTVRYFVNAPNYWDSESKERVQAHFKEFNLAYRYTIEAASELANQRYIFDSFMSTNGHEALIELLKSHVCSFEKVHMNSWQTALYQALVNDLENISVVSTVSIGEDSTSLETCPRCSGSGHLLNSSCDACNGVGAATREALELLGESVYDRVQCSDCIAGNLSCTTCNGHGYVTWEKAKQL